MEKIEDRIDFYIGDLRQDTPVDEKWIMSKSAGYKKASSNPRNGHAELLAQIRKVSDKPFYFSHQEIKRPAPAYVLLRSRIASSGVLINSLYYDRMWGDFYNPPKDIPFNQKKNAVFWRGAPSGATNGYWVDNTPLKRAHRFDLVKKHYKNHDIGFTRLIDDSAQKFQKLHGEDGSKYVKTPMSKEKFLHYKYIISVEGNDNDSGLRWKLNSNSLVIMPKPVSQTWLMEDKLKPNIHYIRVSNDWSDLDEKIEWCNSNQKQCMDIIKNAQEYMKQFLDAKKEQELELKVLRRYFDLISHSEQDLADRWG